MRRPAGAVKERRSRSTAGGKPVALRNGRWVSAFNLALFARYYQARHTLEALFGRQRGFEVLAVDGETPRDPSGLITQVRSTVSFLEEPKVELPSVKLDGVAIDLTAMARQLTTGFGVLRGRSACVSCELDH